MQHGHQSGSAITYNFFALVVRPGQSIAAVPEPETYAMLLAGLGLLGFTARRRVRS
ncbi:MAG: FxDxF family PEP-CTERM protein [Nitrosomonadales bacterium]|nr:FxDxF family PEP-CTERM protein [Nitrosomonadales bacterium]